MITRYILPILAALGLALGLVAVYISRQQPPTPPIPFAPPTPPYEHFVATVGIVEAASEDIFIGTPTSGIVTYVHVEAGDYAEKGAALFDLDKRIVDAKIAEAQASLDLANVKHRRMLELPDPMTVPPAKAVVKEKEADYEDRLARFQLAKDLDNPRAMSRDEYNQRKFAALSAQFALQEAKEQLDKLLAGTWVLDLAVSEAEVKEAEEKLALAEMERELKTVRAPLSGVVMRVNIRPGELAPEAELEEPLMVFGILDPLHIRVDVDEEEVWRIERGAPGMAYVRGNSSIQTAIEFVRLEPYLVPKQALTGSNTELVDTRVLQIIYRFNRENLPIYPGQLIDIYLEAKPSLGAP